MGNLKTWSGNQSKSSKSYKDKASIAEAGDAPFLRWAMEDSLSGRKGSNDKVIALIRKRLDEGNRKFGREMPLDGTYRLQDALEEALDLSIYLSAKILELRAEETKNVNRNRKPR